MLSRHGLRRPWFLEFECYSAIASIGWGIYAYGTRINMAERPVLAALSFMTDDQWAVVMCSLGAIQLAVVLVNHRWGRWLVAVPLCGVWCSIGLSILQAAWRGEPSALANTFYLATPGFLLLKVARLPREFPPRG